jgi:hypothetical protein
LTIFSLPRKDPNEESDLDEQTKKAATALDSPEYDGKIVVVVWEHKHIAKKDLNEDGERPIGCPSGSDRHSQAR